MTSNELEYAIRKHVPTVQFIKVFVKINQFVYLNHLALLYVRFVDL